MALETVATLHWIDTDLGEEAFASIRADHNHVTLALSLQTDGDIEVGFKPDECEQLVKALQEALIIANGR